MSKKTMVLVILLAIVLGSAVGIYQYNAVADQPANVTTVDAAAPMISPTVLPTMHTITGTMTLHWFTAMAFETSAGDECIGTSGYDDMRAGAQELLQDGGGHTIAVASLHPGVIVSRSTADDGYVFVECQFAFTFTDVPDRTFYTVTSGRRGGPTYSRDDLVAAGWTIALSLSK